MHGESILYSNHKLKNKDLIEIGTKKKLFLRVNFKILLIKYQQKIISFVNKIKKRKKKIYLLGCAPRSIKLLFDLPKNIIYKIKCIYEPAISKKINSKIPKLNIKIKAEQIQDKNLCIWMPYHIKKPPHLKQVEAALS